MAYRCEVCDKKTHAGRSNRHHKGVAGQRWTHRAQRTIREFKPNLHWVTLPVSGTLTRMKACTKCIKRIKFDNKKALAATTVNATA
jgi:ribosomal protein L28